MSHLKISARFIIVRARRVPLLCTFAIACLPGWAQLPQTQEKRTPLGTQRVVTPAAGYGAPKSGASATDQMPVALMLQGAMDAHGGRQNLGRIADSVAEGTITLYTWRESAITFPMTLLRKGAGKVQRIIRQPGGEARQGADGSRIWDGFAGLSVPQGSRADRFIESQTIRSVDALFGYSVRGAELRNEGLNGTNRVLAVQETDGTTTRYFVNPSTSRIDRIEFVTGESRNMLSGEPVPRVESYVFSDFRPISGVWTPFRVEHFSSGIKIEEMRFKSVRYNTSLKDDAFRP